MTEIEAFEAFIAKWNSEKKDAGLTMTDDEHDCAEEAWHAALAWLRSQGAPVAHGVGPGDWTYTISSPVRVGTKLFLAPQPAIPDGWQPIETAPEGQDMILAGVMDGPNDWRIKVGHRAVDGETSSYGFKIYGASWEPLMWMPLPAAPEPSK